MIINNKLPFCLKRTNFNIKKFIWCFVPFHLKSLTMLKIKILSYSSGIIWKYMPGTLRAKISILSHLFILNQKQYPNIGPASRTDIRVLLLMWQYCLLLMTTGPIFDLSCASVKYSVTFQNLQAGDKIFDLNL